MKVDEIKNELKQLSINDINAKIDAWRQELFTLRINKATAHVKDYSQFKKLQKNIARALTCLRERELSASSNA